MPKLIDYPRTSYTGAWELAEITDDTGGKCSIETAARKLDRKVSGSFKAIIGSAVKFGLVTSKRELLTTTTLFKRIKHAYDKQEELIFHREAFLTPPLFTQICRKFRGRELPIQMLDVMLIREFGVEEINSQGVSKAFVDGCRMVGLLDERNIMADIDALNTQKTPRRELASPQPTINTFQLDDTTRATTITQNTPLNNPLFETIAKQEITDEINPPATTTNNTPVTYPQITQASEDTPDAVANLFGLLNTSPIIPTAQTPNIIMSDEAGNTHNLSTTNTTAQIQLAKNQTASYQIQITGPGISTALAIVEEDDITLAIALLEKIRRQLKS